MTELSAWIGRIEDATYRVSPSIVSGLAATLDYAEPPWPRSEAPPLAHWLHFLPRARQSELRSDGHPRKGGFLPPVELPRRMRAGSRISFANGLPVGAEITRRSTIIDIRERQGASGKLVFVTVRHDISGLGAAMLTEEQDLVCRANPSSVQATEPAIHEAPRAADIVRSVMSDSMLLFRFSALTFNTHRIHYDRDYATGVEGYPSLVVHGPLIATLLMDHLLRAVPACRVQRFAFRARQPLFDAAPFDLCLAWRNNGADLWTRDSSGTVNMTAEIDAV